MNFVANTNSLILDSRDNRGGDEGMMRLFCSYFYDNQVLLSSTYYRFNNKTIKNITKSRVQGAKYLNKPINILTSNSSFSAAEALSYNLQKSGIAKVIGEKTAGAANPVEMFVFNDEFLFFVPLGFQTNSISNENWGHIGVTPDILVPENSALIKAQLVALNEIINKGVETEISAEEVEKQIVELEEKLNRNN